MESRTVKQDIIMKISYLWRWVDSELQLALLSVVHTQSLHEEGGESRSGTSTEGVEDKESLESSALI